MNFAFRNDRQNELVLHPEPIQRIRRPNPFRPTGKANKMAEDIASIRLAAKCYERGAAKHLADALRLARLAESASQQADKLAAELDKERS